MVKERTTLSENLNGFSEALADVVESAGASVVRVEARRRMSATGIVWSDDGLIVTAHHVVTRDKDINIGLPNGESVSAELVGRDPTTDIALLRVDGSVGTPATWAEDGATRVGNIVLALGRPGRTVQATLGIISALGDGWRTHAGGNIDRYMQTDVVMYPGFSGGPLVNAAGQFVGLNSSALRRGVSMTLPAITLSRVASVLLEHGRVRRGFLGIGAQPVRLPEGVATELDRETGLLIVSVEPNSPAEQGGLLLGDTVLALDGEPVRHIDDLLQLLVGDRVGNDVPVQVLRSGTMQSLNVTIGEHE